MITSNHPGRRLPTFSRPHLLQAVSSLLIALLLAACAATSPAPVVDSAPGPSAEQYFARGNWEQAALKWQQEAVEAPAQQAAGLRVRAADAWMLAGQREQALEALRWVERSELPQADRARMELVLADVALGDNRPDEAASLLRKARPYLGPDSMRRFEDLNRRTQSTLSRPGAKRLAEAAALSASMTEYQPLIALSFLDSLETVSSGELAARAANPRTGQRLSGWLDLTLTIRGTLADPQALERDLDAWKTRHPDHLLTQDQALDLWLLYRQRFSPPRKVAVLLPGSGRLEAAGSAIRDGVISAFLDRPGGSEIVFYDTSDDPQSAISAYFQALDEGAHWIIGPLQKSSVEALLGLAGLTTPVLALNEFPEDYLPPAGLAGRMHSLSLSQDREARSAADHAGSSGYRRAIVLAPESAWGERMATAFEQEFLAPPDQAELALQGFEGDFLPQERQIIAAGRFLASDNDHSGVLERLLRIDESKARKDRLQNTLQIPLEFEAVRRDDVDVIFLPADPQQGRLLRPQLKFHDAGSIPVYSTGRIYSGKPDRSRNQDLNGIRFPISPWQLSHTDPVDIPELESIRLGAFSSLYALGRDAWDLLPWLDLMGKDPDFRFPGESGNWAGTSSGNLGREPAWAEFRRGRPAPLLVEAVDHPGPQND
jgi:outer membrane PBP1 activator LpoA protein